MECHLENLSKHGKKDFFEADSDLISVLSYGTSFEGRDLNVMKIGNGPKDRFKGKRKTRFTENVDLPNSSKRH